LIETNALPLSQATILVGVDLQLAGTGVEKDMDSSNMPLWHISCASVKRWSSGMVKAAITNNGSMNTLAHMST